ncbi:hypothetical protein HMPREF9120_00064 [Neisseria sp. oral taxon 020 str. F0370]|nr:hypothetical protein HMPREF9120_00064 [Neisseria sp. oral taxon 020 str. F0370]
MLGRQGLVKRCGQPRRIAAARVRTACPSGVPGIKNRQFLSNRRFGLSGTRRKSVWWRRGLSYFSPKCLILFELYFSVSQMLPQKLPHNRLVGVFFGVISAGGW